MLLLLAFSAVAAQPLAGRMYGPNGPLPGTPGPYPARYASAYAPQRSSLPSQDQFDLYVANEEVRSDQIARRGNAAAYNVRFSTAVPSTTIPTANQDTFLRFGTVTKGVANSVTEQTIQDKIDYFRATHKGPLTQEDRNTLDDLRLQLDAARNQKVRRYTAALPIGSTIGTFSSTGAQFSAYFERKAHDADLTLAQNQLVDARQDYAKDPSQQNKVDLVNARDTEDQARDKRDANTFDLLGTTVGYAPVAGPLLRKRASASQIEVGQRNLRVARANYANDPSQDNLDQLRLADLFLRASQDDDQANSKDLLVSSLLTNFGTTLTTGQSNLNTWSQVLSARTFDVESRKWLRYSRLKRQILERKIAQKASGASSSSTAAAAAPGPDAVVAQRLVAMSMYGRPSAVAPPRPTAAF